MTLEKPNVTSTINQMKPISPWSLYHPFFFKVLEKNPFFQISWNYTPLFFGHDKHRRPIRNGHAFRVLRVCHQRRDRRLDRGGHPENAQFHLAKQGRVIFSLLGRHIFDCEAWKKNFYPQTYEGGFAQYPGAECHGGSTYCAVAAAKLIYLAQRRDAAATSGCEMDRGLVELFAPNATEERHDGVRQSLIRWCVARQTRGFTGRANKPEDSW